MPVLIRQGRATTGTKAKKDGQLSVALKSASEISVRNGNPRGNAARAWLVLSMPTGCTRHGYATATPRFGRSSAQPGTQLTAYRAEGWFIEQGNSDSGAWIAMPGKPPSPVTFRAEGGVLVVVRAWESHVHGEGEQ